MLFVQNILPALEPERIAQFSKDTRLSYQTSDHPVKSFFSKSVFTNESDYFPT